MRYRNQILPFKFEITKAYFKKLSEKNDQNFQRFLFDLIFPTSTTTYRPFIERSQAYWSQRWPLVIGQRISKLLGNVDIFLCLEMYQNKNRRFTKKLKEIGKIDVSLSMLQIVKMQLSDQEYNVSKIYGFQNLFAFVDITFLPEDFVLPDFKINVKLKDQSSSDSLKEILEFLKKIEKLKFLHRRILNLI